MAEESESHCDLASFPQEQILKKIASGEINIEILDHEYGSGSSVAESEEGCKSEEEEDEKDEKDEKEESELTHTMPSPSEENTKENQDQHKVKFSEDIQENQGPRERKMSLVSLQLP